VFKTVPNPTAPALRRKNKKAGTGEKQNKNEKKQES
jgi:hypothetical protein